jgi:hypothetical protein
MNNLPTAITRSLAPWTPPTEDQWLAADLADLKRKQQDPFRQREADEAMRRELDFQRMEGKAA